MANSVVAELRGARARSTLWNKRAEIIGEKPGKGFKG